MEFFKNLPYWFKGALLGFVIGILISFIIIKLDFKYFNILLIGLPLLHLWVLQNLRCEGLRCDGFSLNEGGVIALLIAFIITCSIIGALIGLIYQKFKK